MFYFKQRLSVAAAMTVLTLIITAFVVAWSIESDKSWWKCLNYLVLAVVYDVGTCEAWAATPWGRKPARLAPVIATFWLFVFAAAVLLYLVGVRAPVPTAVSATPIIPEPAASVLMIVSVVFALYSAVVGFWLATRE